MGDGVDSASELLSIVSNDVATAEVSPRGESRPLMPFVSTLDSCPKMMGDDGGSSSSISTAATLKHYVIFLRINESLLPSGSDIESSAPSTLNS